MAARKGYFEIAKVLISASEFPNAPDNAGNTPYNIALQNKHDEIAGLFPVVGDLKWWCFMGFSFLQPLLIALLANMKI